MRSNRLEAPSMRRAVGLACLRLFFAVVGVSLSLAKVIYGSEFIHACPSKDIIPVYIVVSGCLAVLLSSLKQEYDPEARCESNLKLYTALFSITVNLLWLITGTVWVSQLVRESSYGHNLCPETNDTQVFANDNINELHVNVSAQANDQFLIFNENNVTNEKDEEFHFDPLVWDGKDAVCLKCARHVIFFTLSTVITDWIICVLGCIYLCSFCFLRVIRIKDQILIINA